MKKSKYLLVVTMEKKIFQLIYMLPYTYIVVYKFEISILENFFK